MNMKLMQIKNLAGLKLVCFLLVLIGLLAGCSNDFLDTKYPTDYVEGDSIFVMSDVQSFEQELDMRNTETASWKLFQFPRWLEVSPKEGTVNPGSGVNFHFSINKNEMYFDLGIFALPLVFEVENVGLVQHTVVVWNVGTPEISTTPKIIEADYTLQGMYQIINSNYGILLWEVVNKPTWLTLETTEGMLGAHEYGIWHYSINSEGLEPGDYSGKLEIRHNASPSSYFIEFKFTIEESAYYGDYLSGEFIDARYIKNLNQVVVLTKNPNNLLFFRADSENADTLKLDRIPQCFDLSEDESTLAVGFSNAEISTYSANSRALLRTYPAGNIPANIAFGTENRLFFLENSEFGYYLTGLDLETGSRNKAKNYTGGISVLKKVPGKNLLLASRPGWSPDGLFVFDISNELVTDSLNEYWMSLNGFWMAEDGERIFAGTRRIYQVPDYVPGQLWSMETPPVLGEFDLSSDLTIYCIAHQNSTGKIFIACDVAWNRNTSYIKILDHNTLVEQKTLELNPNPPFGYPPGNTWWSETVKIFPSASGTEIWVIQEQPPADHNDPNMWSIQRLEI